jgi:Na+/H+ antiporter NhaD/arsenite permease-like protein
VTLLRELAPVAPAGSFGDVLPVWSVLPFVALLAAIAILPLAAPEWWGRNRNRALVSLGLALPFAAGLILAHPADGPRALLASILDYVSFLSLLASLYVISGNIHVRGSLAGSPSSNTAMLGVGALLANLIGTTGASMMLIRPLLRANRPRKRKAHLVVFFIFVASNCGGLLTPLGDPPLFLGFLKGVPFAWTLGLWKPWLIANGILLVAFHFVDERMLERDEVEMRGSQLERVLHHEPLSLEGKHNLLLLAGVILAILGKAHGGWAFGVQEGMMLGLAAASYGLTKPSVRTANAFTFAPIVEVAVLFAGIFVTMVAPLEILSARGSQLGVVGPVRYFWATGALSSFLDNAPTYMTFAAAACGRAGIPVKGSRYLGELLDRSPGGPAALAAISCGAVMMGAMTYIGNGPNFMIKSIAEENGVRMPSFGGYLVWSTLTLLPIFLVVTWACFL